MDRLKIAIIGLGRMGGFFLKEILNSPYWQITKICECNVNRHDEISKMAPGAKIVINEDEIFSDPEINAVVLSALADTRILQIEKAVRAGKHVISEKPIAETLENEWKAVNLAQNSNVLTAVNLYMRNSWYLNEIDRVIKSGEIGELAVIRICHLTPGLSPGEGHEAEGPSFHDCGIHYCDAARMLANSEFKTVSAQAVRFWEYKSPWFLQAHGTFENGVVFDITQGHCYGQLSAVQTHNSYFDILGSRGIVRFSHDFKTGVLDIHGETRTERIERPYGGKNIGRLLEEMAKSISSGVKSNRLPSFRDAAVASEFAWRCLADAERRDLPIKGTAEELDRIHYRRAHMTNGYGLLRKPITLQDNKLL